MLKKQIVFLKTYIKRFRLRDWQPSNIQHYQMAQFHGRTVGNNLVLSEIDLKQVDSVPFFWTVQYGKSIRYTGYFTHKCTTLCI